MLTSKEHLYYALGILIYTVASADGKIQREEKEKLHDILNFELGKNGIDFDYSEIIFHILQKDKPGIENACKWALDALSTGKHYLSNDIINKFSKVLRKVAEAFPPKTKEEMGIIYEFEKKIKLLVPNISLT
jgi:hypothetical protein